MVFGSAWFGLIGWTIIPDLATRQLLAFSHKTLASKVPAFTPPVPGTPAYRKHYAYTFASVVLGYLLYNMVQSSRALPPNFYEILGVAPDVDENGLKLAFRAFAKKNHPDRPEVGKDVVRFAYDRFGPSVLSWKSCSTQREYLYHGILQSSGYHIVTGAALLFWSTIGKPSPISFWRYLLFSAFLVSEMSLILAPTGKSTFIFTYLFPNRITYQHVLFLHQLFLFFSVALSRVAPLFSSPEYDAQTEKAILEKTRALASMADREASIILHADLHSITPSPSKPSPITNGRATIPLMTPLPPADTMSFYKSESISNKMRDLIIEHNLKKDSGPLRTAWEYAVQRGRALAALAESVTGEGQGDELVNTSSSSSSTALASSNLSTSIQHSKKNFWEAAVATPTAASTSAVDPSGSSLIDGSTYYVVDDHHENKADQATTINGASEPLPSPRPSPPRSRPASPMKKSSTEVLMD
ncbi:hypothetical protein NP233_g5023 [Leucocoprinus birnbaumii]|uniref:J domain-containing protein n=1 Tax=Leucocoprinus birnbaumii TaxID=56174 RepID=A0AAD5VTK5_9AGAR|nr:hypothetical protein NP233_g5023 [Leucocoprinus birnbaumii]